MATDSYGDLVDFYGDRRFVDPEYCISNASVLNQRAGLSTSRDLATYNCTHVMTLHPMNGGRLGNKMFQAASLIGIAHWHGYTPIFHKTFKTFNLRKIFRLMISYKLTIHNLHYHWHGREYECLKQNGTFCNLDHSKNWSLVGYFQEWKYFHNVEELVRRAFTFKEKYSIAATKYLDSVRTNGVENVCIHVRRGDFLKYQHREFTIFTLAPKSYIERAMNVFYNRLGKVQFIFVSNDMKWCKSNFIHQNDTYFSPFKDLGRDMALLASCDHVIITSGTFGWWGAWLAGGMTVYFKGYPGDRPNTTEYYPDHWIGTY